MVILFILFPIMTSEYYVYLATLILVYSIAAIGLNILTGLSGQISLGHAGFFATGAYVTEIFIQTLQLPYVLSFIFMLVLSITVGILVAIPSLRLKGLYLAIATLAFGLFVERLIYSWKSVTGGSNGLIVTNPNIFGVYLETDYEKYYLILIIFMLCFWIYKNLIHSVIGKRLIAVRDTETASNALGINARKYKVISFVLASVFGAIAGNMYGVTIGFISVEHFDFFVSVSFLVMIVIGGMGTIYGPILGAVFVTILPEILRDVEDYQMFIYGLSIILVMMFWKQGITGLFRSAASRLNLKEKIKARQAQ